MDIRISNENYYLNKLSKEESDFCHQIRKILFEVYPRLTKIIDESYLRFKMSVSDRDKDKLIDKVLIANLKYLKDKYSNTLNKDQINKLIYKSFVKTFPFVLMNERTFSVNSYFMYEPINALSFSLLTLMHDSVDYQLSNFTEEYNIYIVTLMNNIVHSLKSSLILFSIGDDAHGYGLFRGIIEQISRLELASKFPSDFVKSVKMNSLLQCKKMGSILNEEDEKALFDFLKENDLTYSSAESFLLYGWAKDSKGRSMRNATDFIKLAFEDNAQLHLDTYHFTSEFIHEDYIGVPYDFNKIRMEAKDAIKQLSMLIYEHEKVEGIEFKHFAEYICELLLEF